jgi:hypothetical protein
VTFHLLRCLLLSNSIIFYIFNNAGKHPIPPSEFTPSSCRYRRIFLYKSLPIFHSPNFFFNFSTPRVARDNGQLLEMVALFLTDPKSNRQRSCSILTKLARLLRVPRKVQVNFETLQGESPSDFISESKTDILTQ